MQKSTARVVALAIACSFFAKDVPAQEASKGGIEEIVVRARKRDERIQDTPVSVTALSENFLEDSGVARVDEIQGFVPNLIFNTGNQGFDANIRIRGIGTGAPALAFDPGVGVYMDGVFMPRALGALLDVVDVQQIEVLRGPQGTLFGKNTVGGALLVTSVKPQDEFSGHIRVRAGNFDTVETKATLNIPLIEEHVLSRFTFGSRNTRGYTYNRTLDEYYSDHQSQNIIGSLRILPDIDFALVPHTIDVSGQYSRDHNRGRSAQCVFINPDADSLGVFRNSAELQESCARQTPFEFEGDLQGIADLESYGFWGTLQWDLLENSYVDLSAKSLSALRKQNVGVVFDIDNTSAVFLERHLFGGGPLAGEPTRQQQINQELQFNATAWDDRINAVGGVFGFWEESSERAAQATELIAPLNRRISQIEFDFSNWTVALFGQASLDVTDWLSITGGVRRTADKKGAQRREFLLTQLNPDGTPTQTFPVPANVGNGIERRVFYSTTWMGSLRLTATDPVLDALHMDHAMTYFTFSQGFKGGGFNATPSGAVNLPTNILEGFEPETLDNYEIGFKTRAFDDRLSFNLALYWGNYDDIQVVSQRTAGTNPTTGLPTIARITQNAAKARIRGIETEFVLAPTSQFRVIGSAGFSDTEFLNFGSDGLVDGAQRSCTEDFSNPDNDPEIAADARNVIDTLKCAVNDFNGDPTNRSGQRFLGSPQLQTSLSVSYTQPIELGSGDFSGNLVPLLQWSFQSSARYLGQEVAAGRQGGFNLLNARLSYEFYDERAVIAMWGKNLLDVAYFDHIQGFGDSFGNINRYFNAPRTWGGEVSFRF